MGSLHNICEIAVQNAADPIQDSEVYRLVYQHFP